MIYTLLTEPLFATLGLKDEAMWSRGEKRRQKVSTCGSFSYRAISETPKDYLEVCCKWCVWTKIQ